MTNDEEQQVRRDIARFRLAHRDLDDAIDAMIESGRKDPLGIQRLKKRKLALKDMIAALEDQLLPDIIA
jgi:hypothetical protein